jgi:N-acetylneuraminic acid mutarotase
MKLRLSLIISCCLLVTASQAQYAWTQKSDFTGAKRFAGVGFDINGKGYFGTGADFSLSLTSIYNDFWEYDTQTDTWVQVSSYPGLQRYAASGFTLGQNGYLGLGWASANGTAQADFSKYDPQTDTWTSIAGFPGAARYTSTAVGVNSMNSGYVAFGYFPWTNDMYKYDASTQSWNQEPSCPGVVRQSAAGFELGDKVYVGGGSANQSTTLSDFWEYDPITQTWTQVANYPQPIYAAVNFVLDGKGFVGCGRTSNSFNTDFYYYVPQTNTWTQGPSFPGIAREHASGFSIGSKAYVVCGRGPTNNYLQDVWELSFQRPCNSLAVDAGADEVVYFGYAPAGCTTLDATVSGGTPPFSYSWSTGETTSSIKVCPQSATTYIVTVTDNNNCIVYDSVKVCVIDVSCGNNPNNPKVRVCHNTGAGTTVTICISASAVPMHLNNHGDHLGSCEITSCDPLNNRPSPTVDNSEIDQIKAYPNPFNDVLYFEFSLIEESDVKIDIFNSIGQHVKTVFNEFVNSNEQMKVEYTSETNCNCILFYRMQTNSGTYFEKVVMVK